MLLWQIGLKSVLLLLFMLLKGRAWLLSWMGMCDPGSVSFVNNFMESFVDLIQKIRGKPSFFPFMLLKVPIWRLARTKPVLVFSNFLVISEQVIPLIIALVLASDTSVLEAIILNPLPSQLCSLAPLFIPAPHSPLIILLLGFQKDQSLLKSPYALPVLSSSFSSCVCALHSNQGTRAWVCHVNSIAYSPKFFKHYRGKTNKQTNKMLKNLSTETLSEFPNLYYSIIVYKSSNWVWSRSFRKHWYSHVATMLIPMLQFHIDSANFWAWSIWSNHTSGLFGHLATSQLITNANYNRVKNIVIWIWAQLPMPPSKTQTQNPHSITANNAYCIGIHSILIHQWP